MVQRNGMLGLDLFSSERVGISKYSTFRLASSSSLWEASRAIPTNCIAQFSPFLRLIASRKLPGELEFRRLCVVVYRPDQIEPRKSRFILAMTSSLISFGHTASHS